MTRVEGTADVRRWFLNPYVQIAIGALLVTGSELLLKRGAMTGMLASPWTWGGIVTYVLSFASWLYVLRHLPLSIAFALINIVHVLVPLGAWLLLHETISLQRWAGIFLVLCGTVLVARTGGEG
jgi:drug/metabolite transporter (DMT)-like permease